MCTEVVELSCAAVQGPAYCSCCRLILSTCNSVFWVYMHVAVICMLLDTLQKLSVPAPCVSCYQLHSVLLGSCNAASGISICSYILRGMVLADALANEVVQHCHTAAAAPAQHNPGFQAGLHVLHETRPVSLLFALFSAVISCQLTCSCCHLPCLPQCVECLQSCLPWPQPVVVVSGD